jgi:3',5'-cyclic AMP phosphodiesterase CpdA
MTSQPVTRNPRPAAPARRLAHLSDVHFGKIANPGVVDALVEEANAQPLDLVVVSGDLTQRARTEQFRQARAFLDRFRAPVLVVPGNHDVRAWWHNPVRRVFSHASRFRHHITPDETPAFAVDGLAVFGLDSSHGLTIKGGKVRRRHLVEMEAFFENQPPGAFRVLVLHHHLLRLKAIGQHDLARNARAALEAARRSGVELVLCGHLHTSHVAHVEVAPPSPADPHGHKVVVASAGTATSSRGRGADREVNFYNWIAVEPGRFTIEERRFDPAAGAFAPVRTASFAREARGATA